MNNRVWRHARVRLTGAIGLTLSVLSPTTVGIARQESRDAVSPPPFEVELQEAWIPLKDGVRLAADLWRPKGAAGPFPVLLEYIPYRKDDGRGGRASLYSYFARRGYVVARVDIRGTGRSEGTLIPYEYSDIENRDGDEIIAWLDELLDSGAGSEEA